MSIASVLPHINAALNATSTVLLLAGFTFIRLGRRDVHRKIMTAALIVSLVFLVSYLTYHFTAPVFAYRGPAWSRPIYFGMLISHVILAVIAAPLVALTAWRAFHGTFDRHKAVARVTLPIWLYVTVTGVVIYVILYHLTPTA